MIENSICKFLGFNPAQATYTEYQPDIGYNSLIEPGNSALNADLIAGKVIYWNRGTLNNTILTLQQVPVRSIISIYDNPGAFLTYPANWLSGYLVDPSQYYLDSDDQNFCWNGQIIRSYGFWGTIRRTIQVTYVAGMTTSEMNAQMPEIKLAVCKALQNELIGNSYKMFSMQMLANGMMGIPHSVQIRDFQLTLDTDELMRMLGIRDVPGLQFGTYDLPPDCKQILEKYVSFNRYLG